MQSIGIAPSTRSFDCGLPSERHWTSRDGQQPVRLKHIRARAARNGSAPLSPTDPAFLYATGPEDRPFDFSWNMRRLVADIVSRCPEFHHINVDRILFTVSQARTGRPHGLQAKVTPMRLRRGEHLRRRRGYFYQVQRYWVDGVEMLYLVTFCLPRFQDQSFDDKFVTVFHELYHISPAFDGDLRRHEGRYCVHTHSQKEYDHQMKAHARAYLDQNPDPSLFSFLRLNFQELHVRHRKVIGLVVPAPRLIPVAASER